MELLREYVKKILVEQEQSSNPTVAEFLTTYAKKEPNKLKKALGITAKYVAAIGAGILVGGAAGATTGGIGSVAGFSAGALTGKAAEKAIEMIYDRVAQRGGELAKNLVSKLATPDDQRGPMDHLFDLDDEYEDLIQGLDSDLGKKFQRELFKSYQEKVAQIDEEADGDRPLTDFIVGTANDYYKSFLKDKSLSGVGVNVQSAE